MHIIRLLNQEHLSKKMLEKYPYLLTLKQRITDATPLLNNTEFEHTLSTRMFWILNEIHDFPKCIVCGKPIIEFNVPDLTSVYRLTCSDECERIQA